MAAQGLQKWWMQTAEDFSQKHHSLLIPGAKAHLKKLANRRRSQLHQLNSQCSRRLEKLSIRHTEHLRLDFRDPILGNVPAQPDTTRRQRILAQLLPARQRRHTWMRRAQMLRRALGARRTRERRGKSRSPASTRAHWWRKTEFGSHRRRAERPRRAGPGLAANLPQYPTLKEL